MQANPQKEDLELIRRAADLLRAGELVAFPTETVYGLGADASNVAALNKLYAAKGRPTNHPVIVHVASLDEIERWAVDIPASAYELAKAFWPGPMTLILKRAPHVCDQVTGGQESVGLRVPSHPIALSLLREFGGGVAAPSANRFGKLSPTRAQDVEREFGDQVSLVLDGGACQVGIESTIVDLSNGKPRVLRPGMLTVSQLSAALGREAPLTEGQGAQDQSSPDTDEVRVPGGLPSHYAPSTPLRIVTPDEISNLGELAGGDRRAAVISFSAKPGDYDAELWIEAARDPISYARYLYSNLRQLDTQNAAMILIESVPLEPEWSGIRDRLSRAAKR